MRVVSFNNEIVFHFPCLFGVELRGKIRHSPRNECLKQLGYKNSQFDVWEISKTRWLAMCGEFL